MNIPSLFFVFFFFSTSLSEPAEPVGLSLFTGISIAFSGDLSLCSGDEMEPPMSSNLLVELQLLLGPTFVGAVAVTFICWPSTAAADGVVTVSPAEPPPDIGADDDLGAGDDMDEDVAIVAAAVAVGTVGTDAEMHISGVVGSRTFRPCRRIEPD